MTRVLIGTTAGIPTVDHGEPAVIIRPNVGAFFDPRLWPGVLSSLLEAGAADAWLAPILMKKGRPAYALSVLARPDQAPALRDVIMDWTSTLGVTDRPAAMGPCPARWVGVQVTGGTVAIKIASRNWTMVRQPGVGDVAGRRRLGCRRTARSRRGPDRPPRPPA